jgi:hypothetical protein
VQNNNHLEGIMGLPQWEALDIPTPPKITFDVAQQVVLLKEWISL